MHSLTKEQFKTESKNKTHGWQSEILSTSTIVDDIIYLPEDSYNNINLKYHTPTLPSNWKMFKNLVIAAKDAVASGLAVRGPEDTEKALKICAECPQLIIDGDNSRCGGCGCIIRYKVKLTAWHCPLNKW